MDPRPRNILIAILMALALQAVPPAHGNLPGASWARSILSRWAFTLRNSLEESRPRGPIRVTSAWSFTPLD